jgi:hypothetical protein
MQTLNLETELFVVRSEVRVLKEIITNMICEDVGTPTSRRQAELMIQVATKYLLDNMAERVAR